MIVRLGVRVRLRFSGLLALLLASIWPTLTGASSHFTGLDFIKSCIRLEADPDPALSTNQQMVMARCFGYLEGFNDANNALRIYRGEQYGFYCVPDGVDSTDMLRNILIFMGQETRTHQAPAYVGIVAALKTLYPCPK